MYKRQQEFVAKEEEAAQIREERRVEKAEKASEKAEQEKTAALESIQPVSYTHLDVYKRQAYHR